MAKLKEPKDVGKALLEAQQAEILEAAAKSRSRFIFPAIDLALSTAMRSDEITSLRWKDFDQRGGYIVVPKSKTETGEGRIVPVNPNLRAVLDSYSAFYISRFGRLDPDWYVFPFSKRPGTD